MQGVVHQRCFNHPQREAAARCPECRQVYCRECVTEHDDRVMCAACLRKLAPAAGTRRLRWSGLAGLGAMFVGLFTAWLFFHLVGQLLLSMPASLHEGTLWQDTAWEE